MAEPRLEKLVATVLRVPPRPEPPAGDPGSLQVFNAAPGFYRYRLLSWAARQAGTAVGLVLGLLLLDRIEVGPLSLGGDLLRFVEVLSVATYLAQLPFTFLMLRLDYRYRWYMVTDTTLRIREGLLRIREQTMTFANIQNLSIRQGPLQRLFGIADLRVRTAGGGGEHSGKGEELAEAANMHLSFFRGVSNAEQIRDLIMDRMRGLSDTGLGDPDEAHRLTPAPETDRAGVAQLLAAARQLLAETRRLRRSITA